MRFEILTAVVKVLMSCSLVRVIDISQECTASTFNPEDEGNIFLQNAGNHL
jgi:hypothetical protein